MPQLFWVSVQLFAWLGSSHADWIDLLTPPSPHHAPSHCYWSLHFACASPSPSTSPTAEEHYIAACPMQPTEGDCLAIGCCWSHGYQDGDAACVQATVPTWLSQTNGLTRTPISAPPGSPLRCEVPASIAEGGRPAVAWVEGGTRGTLYSHRSHRRMEEAATPSFTSIEPVAGLDEGARAPGTRLLRTR